MTAAGPGSPRSRTWNPPEGLGTIQRRALMVGGSGIVLSIVGGLLNPEQFFRSYLVAFVYTLAIPLGSFGILMLHHLTGGAWGLMIRRVLEASTRTFLVTALFFLPLLPGLKDLYRWARPEVVAADPHIAHQAAFLNVPFFVVRAAIYFGVWSVLAFLLNRLSLEQDRTGDPRLARRMQRLSAGGLLLFALTLTLAAIDWLMSLDPKWFSSIYGFYVGGGAGISALAFTILVCLFLARREPMNEAFRPIHFHDYGKLLLAFVVLWAYFGASQLIIIWQGQIPEETSWYAGRLLGAWKYVSILLILLHFALPFFLLLSRDLKRDVSRLSRIALLLLVMRWVDLYWLARPAFSPERISFHWLDVACAAALGGVWVALFFGELGKRPLLPRNDPYLEEALAHE